MLRRMGSGSVRSSTSSPAPGPRSHPDRKISPVQDRVIPESNCGLTPLIPGQRDAGSTRTSTRKIFALEWVINVVVQLTIAAWLTLEAGLMIRDRVRGRGSAARDRGTLWLNIIIITAAVVAAGILTHVLQNAAAWQFGS